MNSVALCVALAVLAGNPVEVTTEPVPADGPKISASGTVVDSAGQPIANATVYLRFETSGFYSNGLVHSRDVLARTTTDAAGAFDFDAVSIPLRHDEQIASLIQNAGGAQIVVIADGYSVAWKDLVGLTQPRPLRFELVPEASVTGVIHDQAGTPIPNVRINVNACVKWLQMETSLVYGREENLQLGLSEIPWHCTTDESGRFKLPHAPSDVRIILVAQCSGLPRSLFAVDTGNSGIDKIQLSRRTELPVQHSPLNLDMKRGRRAVMRVVDHSGQPFAYGAAQVYLQEKGFVYWGTVDEHGKVEFAVETPGPYRLTYGSDPLNGGFEISQMVEVADGDDPPEFEIRVPEPRWIKGKVVDADTNTPIAGAMVVYAPKTQTAPTAPKILSNAVSGVDGSFSVSAFPGPGSLTLRRDLFGYLVPTSSNNSDREKALPPAAVVNVPESGQAEPVIIQISRGMILEGIVRDADGRPVPDASVTALNLDTPYKRATTKSDEHGRYQIVGLSPHGDSFISALGSDGTTGAIVPGEANHSWTKSRRENIELELGNGVIVTGRILFNGKPRPGVRLKLSHSIGENNRRFFFAGDVVSDADGRYRCGGLFPGDNFNFEIIDPDNMLDPNWNYVAGYVQSVPDGQDVVELPDMNLQARNQTLRGRVVDTKGNPIEGITVSAQLVSGRSLTATNTAPPPWTETDADGRFVLEQLPDHAIQLMAYRSNPNGGVIKFPSYVKPEKNAQDIRIILDPRLLTEVEDLDN